MHLNYTRAGPRAVTAITRELTFARKKIVQVVSRSRGNQLRFADAAEIDSRKLQDDSARDLRGGPVTPHDKG